MNNKRFYLTVLAIALTISAIAVSCTSNKDKGLEYPWERIIVEVEVYFEDYNKYPEPLVVLFEGDDFHDLDEQIDEYLYISHDLMDEIPKPRTVIINEVYVPDYSDEILKDRTYSMVYSKYGQD